MAEKQQNKVGLSCAKLRSAILLKLLALFGQFWVGVGVGVLEWVCYMTLRLTELRLATYYCFLFQIFTIAEND